MCYFFTTPCGLSACSRSTVTSAEEKYLHPFTDAGAGEVFNDDSENANVKNSDRPESIGVRNYVTNEYFGLLRSWRIWKRGQPFTIRSLWKTDGRGTIKDYFMEKGFLNGAPDPFKNAVG